MGRVGRKSKAISMDQHHHEFFKVYLQSLCFHHLSIPPAFIGYFDGKIPKKAVLKDDTGEIWHVELEEVEKDLMITHGWTNFASDHSLEHGDFLIFKYDGNFMFHVKIFGKNGCKKRQPFGMNQFSHVVKEEQTEMDKININIARNSSKLNREISRSQFKNGHHVKKSNPCFVKKYSNSSKYNIFIPPNVLKNNDFKLKQDVMIRDENGRLWPVLVRIRTLDRVALGTGWVDFVRSNRLIIGDKCVFKFIRGRGRNTLKEIKVKVIWANQRI